MMNVLLFTNSISRKAGGLYDAVRDMFLCRSFHSFSLNVFAFWDEYSSDDINSWKSIPIRLFNPGPYCYSSLAKTELLSSNADLLHMEGLWRYPHLLMGRWKKKTRKPIVCTPHGMLDPYIIKKQGVVKRIIAKIVFDGQFKYVDCFQALCKKEYDDIRSYGVDKPIAIIPNGVNLPLEHIQLPIKEKRHLLYLGRLHEKKGVDILLKAIVIIKKEVPRFSNDWQVDIVGWDHENTLAKLQEIVFRNHLGDLVVFHGGLFGNDKAKIYSMADAYILPSHGEGLPMSILEAWSWKKMVIMTPHCNLPEGFEAQAAIKIMDNVESVVGGIKKMLAMTNDERKKMGERGFELVKKEFSWDASAKKLIQVYEWLVNGTERPSFVYDS